MSLQPTFVMALDYVMLHITVSRMTAGSVVVSFIGTILAGWDTFSDDALGYMLAFANDVATALQLLYQKKFNDAQKGPDGKKIGSFGLVYYNAVLALPMTLFGAAVSGEFQRFLEYKYLDDRGFWGALLVSACLGVVLTYAGVLCTTFNSPLTTSMTGCAKDVVGTGLGALLFGDFVFTPASTSGLGISFVGSYMYVYAGYQESKAGKAPAHAAAKATESPRPSEFGSGNSSSGRAAALENVRIASDDSSSSREGGYDDGVSLEDGSVENGAAAIGEKASLIEGGKR